MEQEKLIEAVEKIRRDKHEPWRYVLFTFINGMAQGLGIAMGMTVVLAIVVYFLTIILRNFINTPIVGQYITDILKIVDFYVKQGSRIR
jgi:hypothetical protein